MSKGLTKRAEANPSATHPQAETPIFLTGFARSGTTWVNQLFRDYFDAGFVNEGQFIVSFGLRLGRYGDLNRDVNHERLLRDLAKDDFFAILKRNYAVEIDWNEVAASRRTFSAMVLEVLRQISRKMGKSRIGSKYPVFGRYLDLLNALFPDCRVVHVVRDGRDCALSHQHMKWGHQNVYSAALHWRNYLHKARNGARQMSGRFLQIRYEDLLAKPESSMATLEEFVTGTQAGSITESFLRDRKQLKPEKIGRWRHSMSPRAQAIFEAVAGDTLLQYGYPLTGTRYLPSLLTRGGYIAHDRLSREAWYWVRKVFKGVSQYK